MVRTGPTSESGGMIALTREPSGRRASTIGEASSQRRPSGAMIRSMIRRTWSSSSKRDVGLLELAVALDPDLVGPVDHDLGDRLVAQERLDRAEGEQLGDDRFEQAGPLQARERDAFLDQHVVEQLLDGPAALAAAEVGLWRELGDDAALDARLQRGRSRSG